MNIAFLTPEYVTEKDFAGGLAHYLYRVAQKMKEKGHDVEIFTRSMQDGTIVYDGIIVHRIRVKCSPLDLVSYLLCHLRLGRSFYVLSLSYCLRKSFLKRYRERRFDIVQASNYMVSGLFSTFNCPVPMVTRVSSYEPLLRRFGQRPLTLDQRFSEWLELLALRCSNAVYCPSNLLANVLKKRGLKVNVLEPSFFLEMEEFDEGIYRKTLKGIKYLLFYGRIDYLKGGEVLAQSLSEVLSKHKEMHFVLVGNYGYGGKDVMEHLLRQAGSDAQRIHHLGKLSHSHLYPVISHSQGVVLPSLIDNLPNTLLESMALGKVVIGTRGTSFEQLIEDGKTGILVEPGNPSELSEAMQRVWDMSNTERKRIGVAAQRRVALLSPERTCSELEEYFKRVCSRQGK